MKNFIDKIANVVPFSEKKSYQDIFTTFKSYFNNKENKIKICTQIKAELGKCEQYNTISDANSETIENITQYFTRRLKIQFFIINEMLVNDTYAQIKTLHFEYLCDLQETIYHFSNTILDLFTQHEIKICSKNHNATLLACAAGNIKISNTLQTQFTCHEQTLDINHPIYNTAYSQDIATRVNHIYILLLQGEPVNAQLYIEQCTKNLRQNTNRISPQMYSALEKSLEQYHNHIPNTPVSVTHPIFTYLNIFINQYNYILKTLTTKDSFAKEERVKGQTQDVMALSLCVSDLSKTTDKTIEGRYTEQMRKKLKKTIKIFNQFIVCHSFILNKEFITQYATLIFHWKSYFQSIHSRDIFNKCNASFLSCIFDECISLLKQVNIKNDEEIKIRLLAKHPIPQLTIREYHAVAEDILTQASTIRPIAQSAEYKKLFAKHKIYLTDQHAIKEILYFLCESINKKATMRTPTRDFEMIASTQAFQFVIRIEYFILDQIIPIHPLYKHSIVEKSVFDELIATSNDIALLIQNNAIPMGNTFDYFQALNDYRNILLAFCEKNKTYLNNVSYIKMNFTFCDVLLQLKEHSRFSFIYPDTISLFNMVSFSEQEKKEFTAQIELLEKKCKESENDLGALDTNALYKFYEEISTPKKERTPSNTVDFSVLHTEFFELIRWISTLTKDNKAKEIENVEFRNQFSLACILFNKIHLCIDDYYTVHFLFATIDLFSAWRNFFVEANMSTLHKMYVEILNNIINQCNILKTEFLSSLETSTHIQPVDYKTATLLLNNKNQYFNIKNIQDALFQIDEHNDYHTKIDAYRIELGIPTLCNAIIEDLSHLQVDFSQLIAQNDYVQINKLHYRYIMTIHLYYYAVTMGAPTHLHSITPHQIKLLKSLLTQLVHYSKLSAQLLSASFLPQGDYIKFLDLVSRLEEYLAFIRNSLNTFCNLSTEEAAYFKNGYTQFELHIAQTHFLLGSFLPALQKLYNLYNDSSLQDIQKEILQLHNNIYTPFTPSQQSIATTMLCKDIFQNGLDYLKNSYLTLPQKSTKSQFTNFSDLVKSLEKIDLANVALNEKIIESFVICIKAVQLCKDKDAVKLYMYESIKVMTAWSALFSTSTTLDHKILHAMFQDSIEICNDILNDLNIAGSLHQDKLYSNKNTFKVDIKKIKAVHSMEAFIAQSNETELLYTLAHKIKKLHTQKSKTQNKEEIAKKQAQQHSEKKMLEQALKKNKAAQRKIAHQEKEADLKRVKEDEQEKLQKKFEQLSITVQANKTIQSSKQTSAESTQMPMLNLSEESKIHVPSIEEIKHNEMEKIELSCENIDPAFSEMALQFKDLNLHETIPQYHIEIPKAISNTIIQIKKHSIATAVVGGYVRDKLFNLFYNTHIKPNDIDIYVQCEPKVLITLLPDYALKKYKEIELKHTGIIIYLFKTEKDGMAIDFICTKENLELYFKSYDFTFNAVACDENGKVSASTQALQDFKNKDWNTILPLDCAFKKNPHLILRAVLLSNHINISLPTSMILMMQQDASLIATIEFDIYLCYIAKTFLRGSAKQNLDYFKQLQLLNDFIPFLKYKLTNKTQEDAYHDYCIKLLEPIDKFSQSERKELYHAMLILIHLLKPWKNEASTFFSTHTKISSKHIDRLQEIYKRLHEEKARDKEKERLSAVKTPSSAIINNYSDHHHVHSYQPSYTILYNNPQFNRTVDEMNANPFSRALAQGNHIKNKICFWK